MTAFTQYRRSQIAELRSWQPGEDMSQISVSIPDREAGSPKPGDMIARNPKNPADQWLVAAQYFADNFEPVGSSASKAALPEEAEVINAVSILRFMANNVFKEDAANAEAAEKIATLLSALASKAQTAEAVAAKSREEALEEAAKYHDAEAARMRRIWKDGDHSVNEDIMRHDLFASRIRALKSSRADSGRAPATEGAKS